MSLSPTPKPPKPQLTTNAQQRKKPKKSAKIQGKSIAKPPLEGADQSHASYSPGKSYVHTGNQTHTCDSVDARNTDYQLRINPACAVPRRIALVVRVLSVPTGSTVFTPLVGFANMMPEINTYDDLLDLARDCMEGDYTLESICLYATTRPSFGELYAPLRPWDLKNELLCEENWEAVLNVAEVQRWLGVTVIVG